MLDCRLSIVNCGLWFAIVGCLTSIRKFEDNLNWKIKFEESESRCNELTNQLLSLSNFDNKKDGDKKENDNENMSPKEQKLQATTNVLQKFNQMLTNQRDKQSKENLQLKDWIYSQLKLYKELHCQIVNSVNNNNNNNSNGSNQFTQFWDERILYFENNFLDSCQRQNN